MSHIIININGRGLMYLRNCKMGCKGCRILTKNNNLIILKSFLKSFFVNILQPLHPAFSTNNNLTGVAIIFSHS